MPFLDDASAYSALVAPVVDRVAISGYNAVSRDEMTALRGEHRFHPAALGLIAGMLCAGPITKAEYSELMRYQHFGTTEQFLSGLSDRGAITVKNENGGDGSMVATPEAIEVAQAVASLQAASVTKLFAPRSASLSELRALITRCRQAAMADPISTLSRLAGRAWLPADASDAAHIWDTCIVLRLHRSDAHATAWAEAGLTAMEMKALEPGTVRDAIEVRTNVLAATPWIGLTVDERVTLLAGLGALPGTGSPI